MKETDWNRCTDPPKMLKFLRERERLSERKARLFAVACCSAISIWAKEFQAQADLLHDLFGNPFRHQVLRRNWLRWNDGMVRRLAESVYEERFQPNGTFDRTRLAVLADALEEAGCDNNDLLLHLRHQGGVHVRGCWAVDLLLNKQ